jgi:hypothetical protein
MGASSINNYNKIAIAQNDELALHPVMEFPIAFPMNWPLWLIACRQIIFGCPIYY